MQSTRMTQPPHSSSSTPPTRLVIFACIACVGRTFPHCSQLQVHAPLEVPAALLANFSFINNTNRAHYAALAHSLDTLVGNVVDALVARGMWNSTLLVLSSDNGGPVYLDFNTDSVLDGSGNNWPLRGGKVRWRSRQEGRC